MTFHSKATKIKICFKNRIVTAEIQQVKRVYIFFMPITTIALFYGDNFKIQEKSLHF